MSPVRNEVRVVACRNQELGGSSVALPVADELIGTERPAEQLQVGDLGFQLVHAFGYAGGKAAQAGQVVPAVPSCHQLGRVAVGSGQPGELAALRRELSTPDPAPFGFRKLAGKRLEVRGSDQPERRCGGVG
jgi:hypothetical protein